MASLIAIICFYLTMLVMGIVASWRGKTLSNPSSEDVMLAGRKVGVVVGIFTMTGDYYGYCMG